MVTNLFMQDYTLKRMNCEGNNVDYPNLVRQAQNGDQQSMEHLVELTKGRISAYIYRITLDYDLTEDLTQETLLEIVKSLKRLRNEERFWPWLYRTALGKVQHYYRQQQRKRLVEMSMFDKERLLNLASKDHNDGLTNSMRKELAEAIFRAIKKLRLKYRNVLILRCLDQMSFAEIAAAIDCSEMQARVLLFRAKNSLRRQLSRRGFKKSYLLTALALFGRLTAPAEAAVVNITAASTKVGITAAIIGAVGTKMGMLAATAVTAAAITVGSFTATYQQPVQISRGADFSPGQFEYPRQLINAYDPNGIGWRDGRINDKNKASKNIPAMWHVGSPSEKRSQKSYRTNPLIPVSLERGLIGPPPLARSVVSLRKGCWVELKFRSNIIDGPGYDIIINEMGTYGEQAKVYLTDGIDKMYLLGTAASETSRRNVSTWIGFDISDVSLAFIPSAVRIVGMDNGGTIPGFDLHCVRARVGLNNQ